MIDGGQRLDLGRGLRLRAQRAHREIQLEQHPPACLVAHQALDPEHRRQAAAARHRLHAVHAARRVHDRAPRSELHAMRAQAVLNRELAAVVFLRSAQEHGRRDVGAHRDRNAHHRIVDVPAVCHPRVVAAEKRPVNAVRQRGREERRIAAQTVEHERRAPARGLRIGPKLQVILDVARRRTRGGGARLERAAPEFSAHRFELGRGENCGNLQQHTGQARRQVVVPPVPSSSTMPARASSSRIRSASA